jgi:hypothetical protein
VDLYLKVVGESSMFYASPLITEVSILDLLGLDLTILI